MSNEKHYSNNPVSKWVADIAIPEHKQIVQRIQQQFKLYNLRDWVKTVDGKLDKELAITLVYTVLNTPLEKLIDINQGVGDIGLVSNVLGLTWLDKITMGHITELRNDPLISAEVVRDSNIHLVGYLQPFRFNEDIKRAKEHIERPLGKFTTEDLIKELKQRVCKGVDPELLELNFTFRVDLEK